MRNFKSEKAVEGVAVVKQTVLLVFVVVLAAIAYTNTTYHQVSGDEAFASSPCANVNKS